MVMMFSSSLEYVRATGQYDSEKYRRKNAGNWNTSARLLPSSIDMQARGFAEHSAQCSSVFPAQQVHDVWPKDDYVEKNCALIQRWLSNRRYGPSNCRESSAILLSVLPITTRRRAFSAVSSP